MRPNPLSKGEPLFVADGSASSSPAWGSTSVQLFEDLPIAQQFLVQMTQSEDDGAKITAQTARVVPVGFVVVRDRVSSAYLSPRRLQGSIWTQRLDQAAIFDTLEATRHFRDSVPGAQEGFVQMIVRPT